MAKKGVVKIASRMGEAVSLGGGDYRLRATHEKVKEG